MTDRPFRILLVEDDQVQAKLAKAVLNASGFSDLDVAETAAAALERAPQFDLLLLDVQLPDGNGLDVLRRLRERSSRPAVVLVTGFGAEQIAVEALRLGADDYVSKSAGFIDLLPGVVERVRRLVGLREALEAAEQEAVVSERRTAVGEMTVALHHELNNPLMAALTEVQLLKEEPGLPPVVMRGFDVIQSSLERIKDAVKRAGEADGARRISYIAGNLKMIDLDGPAVQGEKRGRAVVAAQDPALRRVIAVLLRRAGFELETFETAAETNARLDHLPTPAVVLAAGDEALHSECRRDHQWPLVVLAPPGGGGILGRYADLIIPIPFDPETFAAQVVAAVAKGRRVGG